MLHNKSHVYIPYEENLDIPTISTRKQHKELGVGVSDAHQSLPLFGNAEHDRPTEGK